MLLLLTLSQENASLNLKLNKWDSIQSEFSGIVLATELGAKKIRKSIIIN